jgi:hypothetical protein
LDLTFLEHFSSDYLNCASDTKRIVKILFIIVSAIVGAGIVTTAIAVPLVLRNAASTSSSTTAGDN